MSSVTRVSSSSTVANSSQLIIDNVSKVFDAKSPDNKAVDSISLTIEPGQFVTLLGPSGCGKTTTLRMVAGFEQPSAGDILLDGNSLLSVPPNLRPMSMVFQSYALFPHLTVEENVQFGLKIKKTPAEERKSRARRSLELMSIDQYASRFPHELSGGQQQRVALARALVMEPRILLFDEPLSNLDARLRMRMRDEIRDIQQRLGITSIFVTHDQSEALAMSDVIVVMNAGRIEQVGSPKDVYQRPVNRFVATFLGTANFLTGKVREVTGTVATVDIDGKVLRAKCADGTVAGQDITVIVRSEDLRVKATGPAESHIAGTVSTSTFDGATTAYTIASTQGDLKAEVPGNEPTLAPGTQVFCSADESGIWVLPE